MDLNLTLHPNQRLNVQQGSWVENTEQKYLGNVVLSCLAITPFPRIVALIGAGGRLHKEYKIFMKDKVSVVGFQAFGQNIGNLVGIIAMLAISLWKPKAARVVSGAVMSCMCAGEVIGHLKNKDVKGAGKSSIYLISYLFYVASNLRKNRALLVISLGSWCVIQAAEAGAHLLEESKHEEQNWTVIAGAVAQLGLATVCGYQAFTNGRALWDDQFDNLPRNDSVNVSSWSPVNADIEKINSLPW